MPKWGSDEFNEAIKKHDEEADPKRSGQRYEKDANQQGDDTTGKQATPKDDDN